MIHFPWTIPECGRRVKVLGLAYGIMPGWHVAYRFEGKWYHHSHCRVTCVVAWRYV